MCRGGFGRYDGHRASGLDCAATRGGQGGDVCDGGKRHLLHQPFGPANVGKYVAGHSDLS